MNTSHHGLADVSENLFMGSMAVEIKVHGESILMSDREFRDVLACARDLFPSMFMWPLPEPVRPHPSVDAERARRCQYCGHKLAQIFDVDGAWCGDECQHNDRQSEVTWWRKAVER